MARHFDYDQPVSCNALVRLLDAPRQSVERAIIEVPQLNDSKEYPLGPAIRAVLDAREEALVPAQERARKDKEMADKYELENAITKGEQAPVTTLDDTVGKFARSVKALMRRKRKLPQETKVEIMDLIAEILEEIAKGEG